jgi:hypothetical protein
MSANVFGKNLTRYLGRGGVGKIMANAANVLQIANRCGGVAELAAGTYPIPTLESGQTMFWFWAQATGAVTITGAATLATNETALIIQNADGSWSAHVFAATGDDFATQVGAALVAGTTGFIDIPLPTWRETGTNDIWDATNNGGVLATDTTPALEYVNGDTDSQIRILYAAGGAQPIATQLVLPPDCDLDQNLVLNIVGVMGGASDTPVISVDAFFNNGDTKVEVDSGTFDNVADKVTATITAADVPDAPWASGGYTTVSLELTPGTHASDTLAIWATYLTYTRKFA